MPFMHTGVYFQAKNYQELFLTVSLAIFWKKTPFLLQFFGKKHAVFLAKFAKMYPFFNIILLKLACNAQNLPSLPVATLLSFTRMNLVVSQMCLDILHWDYTCIFFFWTTFSSVYKTDMVVSTHVAVSWTALMVLTQWMRQTHLVKLLYIRQQPMDMLRSSSFYCNMEPLSSSKLGWKVYLFVIIMPIIVSYYRKTWPNFLLSCRDLYGNNPVHLAAINGYTNTMVSILSVDAHLTDIPNNQGVSTLQY